MLTSIANGVKNKETTTIAAVGNAFSDLPGPFLGQFDDLIKDLVWDNLDKALDDIADEDLFVEHDKMLLGEDTTPAITPSKVLSAGSGTHAENVPSISLLLECFELWRSRTSTP